MVITQKLRAAVPFLFLFTIISKSQTVSPITQREACRQFMPAIVRVNVADGNASGFIVSSDGWIVTAGHVVFDDHTGEQRATISVRLPNRQTVFAKVFVDQASAVRDFALLKVDASNLPFLQLATTDEVVPGVDLQSSAFLLAPKAITCRASARSFAFLRWWQRQIPFLEMASILTPFISKAQP